MRFLRWWGRELAALVPPALRPKDRPSPSMLWAGMEQGALVLWRLAGQKRSEIGRVNLAAGDAAAHKIAFDALLHKAGARSVGVCLPATQVLRKEVILPLAAAENLTQVLGFELGRQTPYTADQAYYDQRVLREDRSNNRLHVLLGVAPKTVIDEILAYLTAWGVTPQAVVVSDELESTGSCLNLLPARLRPKPSHAGYWLYGAMAGVTLVLFAALLVAPLWKKREVVIALQPVLAQAQQQADAVDALKREQERLVAEYNFPTEHKLAMPAKVALLEEVTRILPDNTWLQQLEIHGTDITMQGNTGSSASLIGLFEQSTLLENANFKSPLVKVQAGRTQAGQAQAGEERFQLAAGIKAIDPVGALATLRGLHQNKLPAKAGKQPAKP
ncbi:MAG: PilN domain-containing protein [Thiobacillus sp.]|nr:PilN domain-containing protein [Thiobacillus sp.]